MMKLQKLIISQIFRRVKFYKEEGNTWFWEENPKYIKGLGMSIILWILLGMTKWVDHWHIVRCGGHHIMIIW